MAFVLGVGTLGFSVFLHSSAWSDLAVSVMVLAEIGLPMLLHSYTRLNSPVPVLGWA